MKIGLTAFQQPIVPKRSKNEKPVEKETSVAQPHDAKQVLKETVRQQIAEIEAARTDMGEMIRKPSV